MLTERQKINKIVHFINEQGIGPEATLVLAVLCIKAVGVTKFRDAFAKIRPEMAAEIDMAVKIVKNRN